MHTVPNSTSHPFRPNTHNKSIIVFKFCVHSSKIGRVENSEIYCLNGLLVGTWGAIWYFSLKVNIFSVLSVANCKVLHNFLCQKKALVFVF